MAKYRITDNVSGKTLVISGDNPPTEQEAEELFQSSGVRNNNETQPTQSDNQQPLERAVAKTGLFDIPVLGGILRGAENSTESYGRMVGGAGYESLRALKSVLGDKNAYVNQETGKTNENPFLSQEDLAKLSQQDNKGALIPVSKEGLGRTVNFMSTAATAKSIPNIVKGGVDIATGGVKNATELINNIKGANSINPSKVVGYARNKAAEAAGELNTEQLIKAGDEFISKNPLAKDTWETFKPTITSKMDTKDLLDRMSNIFGQAYTRGGDVRSTAEAGLMNKLYGAGKSVIKDQAPNVAKYTDQFRFLYNLPKTTQKATWLALKATAIGKLLGL